MSAIEHVPVADRDTYALIPQAADLADRLARTEFVPSGLRGKPEAVMAAMLQGHEVGLPPMMSLSKIAVINGTPSMAAEAMRALVLSHGHDIYFEEKNTTKVTICGSRCDKDRVSRVTWTMDDAKRAGLAGKPGWRAYPRAYLAARATSELCRDLFADVLGGISYTPEEAEDFDDYVPDPEGDADLGDAPAAASATRKARKAVTKKRGPSRATPPVVPAASSGQSASPAPPLPGEDGYDNVLELPSTAARPADEADHGDAPADDVDDQPEAGDVIDLAATIEQAGIAKSKFLRQARSIAETRGIDVPASFEKITDDVLIRATLDDLGLAAVMSSTPDGPGPAEPTEARNKKMWAQSAEAWPEIHADQLDSRRKALIRVVSNGRTNSSKNLTDDEWSELFAALDAITEGIVQLAATEQDGWTLVSTSKAAE